MSSKGDGRYVISNGKDQALRLWDLRRMRSNEEFDEIGYNEYHIRGYDYRYVRPDSQKGSLRESINRRGVYLKPRVLAHPKDCSVMTYRGHAVLKTLIRCYFSPAETTGGQYIYSGSYDGKIHVSISITSEVTKLLTLEYGGAKVWSLDGTTVQVLDRSQTLPMACDPSGPEPDESTGHQLRGGGNNRVCVRDVSWHPQVRIWNAFRTFE